MTTLISDQIFRNNSQIFSKIQDKEDEKAWLSGNQVNKTKIISIQPIA